MRLIFIITSFLFFSISGIAQSNILENKEYSIVISEACKSFKDGGCLITNYHILKFEKSMVTVTSMTKADCEPAERNEFYEDSSPLGQYSYQIHKKKGSNNYFIRINGYSFNLLEVYPDYLIQLNPDHTTNSDHIFKLVK